MQQHNHLVIQSYSIKSDCDETVQTFFKQTEFLAATEETFHLNCKTSFAISLILCRQSFNIHLIFAVINHHEAH